MPSRSTADADSLQGDLAAFGLPPDAFAAALLDEAETACHVDPDNWATVMVFLALQTQWRREFAGISGQLVWQGLRYSEARTVIELMGYAKQACVIFDGLRLMESEALPLLNKGN